jgi:hypothetical protein
MSHELDDNIERRHRIIAKIRQHPKGVSLTTLTRIIMEMGYNLRGAKEKIKELSYGGWIREQNLLFYDAETLSHARRKEEGNGMVAKGSGQEDS